MSEVYEQIRIVLEHVHMTAFATVLGTFRSQVMQMGDCNAPSMFQWLMTAIFWDCISQFIHVYLDDIFIYSRSIEEHEKHLGIVFQWLRDHHLFLSKSKVDLYSKRLECLGHIIDDQGIHMDADKMQCIHEWRCPRTFNNIQCFLGLVSFIVRVVLFSFNIKLRNFVCILNKFFVICGIYVCVTKHGVWCLSPAGVNQVNSRAGINFVEIYAYEKCLLFI